MTIVYSTYQPHINTKQVKENNIVQDRPSSKARNLNIQIIWVAGRGGCLGRKRKQTKNYEKNHVVVQKNKKKTSII